MPNRDVHADIAWHFGSNHPYCSRRLSNRNWTGDAQRDSVSCSILLGDRNLPWWAILGSIVATETSTATVLSVPGLGYGPTGMRFTRHGLYLRSCHLVVRYLLPLYFRGSLF